MLVLLRGWRECTGSRGGWGLSDSRVCADLGKPSGVPGGVVCWEGLGRKDGGRPAGLCGGSGERGSGAQPWVVAERVTSGQIPPGR